MSPKLALSLLVGLILSVVSSAQTTRLVPTAAYPTIQSAFDAAAAGDTVQIAAGLYSGGLILTKPITIVGAGPGQTIIDGHGLARGLDVMVGPGQQVEVRDLQFRNGRASTIVPPTPSDAGGAISFDGGLNALLRLENLVMRDCVAAYGGAVSSSSNTSVQLVSCRFIANGYQQGPNIDTNGGAVRAQGTLQADDCDFIGNTALIRQNTTSGGYGGAVLVHGGFNTTSIRGCRFRGNAAGNGGGIAVVANYGATIAISDCEFRDNDEVASAAAIFLGTTTLASQARIENCLFVGNAEMATWGCSTVYATVGTIDFVGCTFAGNRSSQAYLPVFYGNALTSFGLRNSIFADNGDDGAYLLGSSTANTVISHCLIENPVSQPPATRVALIERVAAGFRDPATGDFRLRMGSPALEAGMAVVGDAPVDLAGLPRLQLGAPDLGCYEKQASDFDPAGIWRGSVTDPGGAPADVLFVDGSTGGPARRVHTQLGAQTTIALLAPPGGTAGQFTIWGRIGLPTEAEALPIYFAQGTMAFLPHLLAPGDPALFTFASSVFSSGLLYAPAAPWQVTGAALGIPMTITLQGLMETGAGDIRVTNAIAIHNH